MNNLQKFMEAKSLSAEQLADNAGIDINILKSLLNHEGKAPREIIQRLADTLNVPLNTLIDLEGTPAGIAGSVDRSNVVPAVAPPPPTSPELAKIEEALVIANPDPLTEPNVSAATGENTPILPGNPDPPHPTAFVRLRRPKSEDAQVPTPSPEQASEILEGSDVPE